MNWKDAALLHAKDQDPKEAVGLLLNVKGKHRYYPFQNLYTTYSLIDSEKNVINSDMIELQLFEKKYGYPLGSGVFNSFIIDSTFLKTQNILKNEDYKLLIKHSMRSESLKGIKKLGLTITD